MTPKIGSKIKQLREARQISVEQMAAMSELAPHDIEAIENSEIIPSLAVLIRITRALGIRIGTILDGEESQGPVLTRKGEAQSTLNISKCPTLKKNHEFFSLAAGKADRNMEPFIVNLEYLDNRPENYSHHEGEEFIYILDGEARLHYGVETYELSSGDSVYYDSLVPHCLAAAKSGTTAKILAVTHTPL